jgi:hypothetical protein
MLRELVEALLNTCLDVLPITLLIVVFQLFVLRQPIPRLRRMICGYVLVLVGLSFFLVGLERALFQVGRVMAEQLASPMFVFGTEEAPADPAWWSYGWVYLFAAAIGFSTTAAEPALMAVALKAGQVSGGTIKPLELRIAVSIGVAIGITLGAFRIVTGTPLVMYISIGYAIVVIQTMLAPKSIIPLAYDSGGVTTSTVTVPLVAALGLGLADTIPGRSPILDGFGMIAFASLFPMTTVMGYAQFAQWRSQRKLKTSEEG